jgi:hypothetical protein
MGLSESEHYSQELHHLKQQYQFLKELRDPLLGELKFLKHRNTGLTAGLITIQTDEDEELHNLERRF